MADNYGALVALAVVVFPLTIAGRCVIRLSARNAPSPRNPITLSCFLTYISYATRDFQSLLEKVAEPREISGFSFVRDKIAHN